MAEGENYKNQLLIAAPTMTDPSFCGTVLYIVGHDENGARGFVINRNTSLALRDVLSHSGITVEEGALAGDTVYIGGPVLPERGFVLHEPACVSYMYSEAAADDVMLTFSKDVIEEMAQGRGPARRMFLLGYAGWGPGQLESEMARGDWIAVPSSTDILFDTPGEQRLDKALAMIGITREQFEGSAGQSGNA